MQEEMKKETVQTQDGGVSIELNGNFDIVDIKLNPDLRIDDQEKAILKCFKKAKEEIQKKMISKLGGMF